jgi:hypothetical protein
MLNTTGPDTPLRRASLQSGCKIRIIAVSAYGISAAQFIHESGIRGKFICTDIRYEGSLGSPSISSVIPGEKFLFRSSHGAVV